MRTPEQIHHDGATRFGQRWSPMVLAMIETLRENSINPDTPESRALVAELARNACMCAWGVETAHSANVPCSRQSVGVIIRRGDDLLLVERLSGAVGMACVAGHVEPGETFEEAAVRETQEESGLQVISLRRVTGGRRYERCKRAGSDYHDWVVFEAEVANYDAHHNPTESKRIGYFSPDLLAGLVRRTEEYLEHIISEEDWRSRPGFERVWFFWLRQAGYLEKWAV
jgi:ADP-ribose pyrophosphatase YjhB (NUDIX family)